MLTWLPACTHRCADCGTPSGDGQSCPDRLYELLLQNYRGQEAQHRLALACFALQHPHTHSANCLAVARFQLESALQAAGQDPSYVCPVSRWIASNLAKLGFRRRWHITVASFQEQHPGSDDDLLLAWAREVLRKSPAPPVPALPS
jgi:Family of unknown function (DUF5946)